MARVIPAQNIYYLLLYAWNRVPLGGIVDVSGVETPDLPNLLAKALLDGMSQLLVRGLDRGYVQSEEDLVRPRGRIRLSDTLARGLSARNMVACTTDEFSRDVLHNQVIKTTLERLSRTIGLDRTLRDRVTTTIRALYDIRTIPLTAQDFARVQLHSNNAFYAFLLRICALLHEALLPSPGGRNFRFRDLAADQQAMGTIFQQFVRNFFRLEQRAFSVSSESYDWPVVDRVGRGHDLMPSMNTDVSLITARRIIIVECKWTSTTLQSWQGKRTLRSEHMYQLSAYVRHHRRAQHEPHAVEGLLLYPLVDQVVNVDVRLGNQRIRARTLDLACDWPFIRAQLLALLEEEHDAAPGAVS